jgi:hypothetical protein
MDILSGPQSCGAGQLLSKVLSATASSSLTADGTIERPNSRLTKVAVATAVRRLGREKWSRMSPSQNE